MSNKEYRALDKASYSLLKRLDEFGPRNFSKSFKVEGDSIDFGSYVDCIMFTPENASEEYYFESIEKPTNQVLELADHIINFCEQQQFSLNDYIDDPTGVLPFANELNLFGSTKDSDKRIAKFNNDLFWNYLKARRDGIGKTILSIDIKSEAEEAISIIKEHDKTSYIFYISGNKEAFNQMQITGEIEGVELKIMLDRVIFDHDKKRIIPYDLKCTDMRQVNFPYWYKKMRYYLQSALYYAILKDYAEEHYPEYTVDNFRFIVYSRSDKFPFVWYVPSLLINQGLLGFTDDRGGFRKGIVQLLKEYKYYRDTGNFNIEVTFIENAELDLT